MPLGVTLAFLSFPLPRNIWRHASNAWCTRRAKRTLWERSEEGHSLALADVPFPRLSADPQEVPGYWPVRSLAGGVPNPNG
jgi:hypothetical protein